MGSLCSKSSAHSGGHTVLGSTPGAANAAGDASSPPNPRAAAAEAAERRLKTAQARGTHASNPKKGQLASQAAKQSSKFKPEPREQERLVWD